MNDNNNDNDNDIDNDSDNDGDDDDNNKIIIIMIIIVIIIIAISLISKLVVLWANNYATEISDRSNNVLQKQAKTFQPHHRTLGATVVPEVSAIQLCDMPRKNGRVVLHFHRTVRHYINAKIPATHMDTHH